MELTETVSWDGRTIACGRAGDGPDVVFCHGTPFSSRVWSRFADALAADYTVHLWDMPGYGESSKHPAHPTDAGHQAQALAALLDHWGLDAPHVVAHDVGGATALQATLAEGRRYASLLLVDVVAIPPAGSPFFRFVQQHPDLLGELPAYIHEAIVRAYVQGAAHRPMDPVDLDVLVAPWVADPSAFYRQIAEFDVPLLDRIEASLGGLSAPVHVVWGERDEWIPIETGRRLADLLDTDLTPIPDAGHLVHLDAPDDLLAAVTRWLTDRA